MHPLPVGRIWCRPNDDRAVATLCLNADNMSVPLETPTLTYVPTLTPGAAGVHLSAVDFDAAETEPGWRYELIGGVLIVSPATDLQERGPSDWLGYRLNHYRASHSKGASLDATLPEHDIRIGADRRRADRVVWAGLGRKPKKTETPTIAIEFVSAGKRNFIRDYEIKRDEYQSAGVQEYWVFNRFDRTMTVFKSAGVKLVLGEQDVYKTDLLSGFELSLAELFAEADAWSEE